MAWKVYGRDTGEDWLFVGRFPLLISAVIYSWTLIKGGWQLKFKKVIKREVE